MCIYGSTKDGEKMQDKDPSNEHRQTDVKLMLKTDLIYL